MYALFIIKYYPCGYETLPMQHKTFLSDWSIKILIIVKKLREIKDVIIIASGGSSVATNMGVAQETRSTLKKTTCLVEC